MVRRRLQYRHTLRLGAIVCSALAAAAAQSDPDAPWQVEGGWIQREVLDDDYVWTLSQGLTVRFGDTEIRAQAGVLLEDRDSSRALLAAAGRDDPQPRRSVPAAPSRRVLDERALVDRLAAMVAAAGRMPPLRAGRDHARGRERLVTLPRSIYLEGEVTVLSGGSLLLRAESLFLSVIDDRMVMRDAELRLHSTDRRSGSTVVLTLRGPELLRQGPRITGRDVSLTTSRAGAPHFEIAAGEVEVLERGDQLEVRSRGNRLLVHGATVSSLPDVDFFTGEQAPLLLKGATGGYSSEEGARLAVELGSTWNRLGGAMHEWLTGDPASDFRGEWRLQPGVIQERGLPLQGELDFSGGDLYRGSFHGFWMSDRGEDHGPIRRRLDGSLIDERDRGLLRGNTRVHLGDDSRLDLEVFAATDPAVYPEFFTGEWLQTEIPETRAYLRHGRDNWLVTAGGRVDVNGFGYADSRNLAPRFLEEVPYATADLFSEPILDLPGGSPLLLTSSGSIGILRFHDDVRAPAQTAVETFRLDEEIELAAPFAAGAVTVRPFVFGRVTHYGDSPAGRDVTRWSYGAGVRAGTRLQRTWSWPGDDRFRLRHVVNPEVALFHRTRVGGSPMDVFQLDPVDALDEDVTLRVGVVNRVQTARRSRGGDDVAEAVWLDLAQNFKPISNRDNAGDVLGLFEYELLLRPGIDWPLPNLAFLFEGEHDWNSGKARTLNIGIRSGPILGANWTAEYRKDRVRDGVLLYGLATRIYDRWEIQGSSSFDLDGDRTLNYGTMIVRNDLDWVMRLGITYDNLRQDTSVFVRFEPTLGGLVETRQSQLQRISAAWGGVLEGY